MSQVEVYALRIRRDLSSSERSALLEILPYNRRQRLLRTREDKQIQALCAYGALHLALHQQYDFFGFPPIAIAEGGKRKRRPKKRTDKAKETQTDKTKPKRRNRMTKSKSKTNQKLDTNTAPEARH